MEQLIQDHRDMISEYETILKRQNVIDSELMIHRSEIAKTMNGDKKAYTNQEQRDAELINRAGTIIEERGELSIKKTMLNLNMDLNKILMNWEIAKLTK